MPRLMRAETARAIVSSRLLILQTKRLLLNSSQRRFDALGLDTLRQRVERLRLETDLAQHAYRATMLAYGSPAHADYWLVAYARLIEMGRALTSKLRDSAMSLAPAERYQASADVEMLETLIERWTEEMHRSMAEAVA